MHGARRLQQAVLTCIVIAVAGFTAAVIDFGRRDAKQEYSDGNMTVDHAVGKRIIPFTATKMDGTVVDFPGDYKGKIVMLDFWATWCQPCMSEVPNLVKAYTEAHSRGLEVLGISLDGPDRVDKVGGVLAENGMTWSQVHDGKNGRAAIAELYDIQSIPTAFLVDGDTGEILAMGNSLREQSLTPTIERVLARRAKKNK